MSQTEQGYATTHHTGRSRRRCAYLALFLAAWIPLMYYLNVHAELTLSRRYAASTAQVAWWDIAELWTGLSGGFVLMWLAYWPSRVPHTMKIVMTIMVGVAVALTAGMITYSFVWSPLVPSH